MTHISRETTKGRYQMGSRQKRIVWLIALGTGAASVFGVYAIRSYLRIKKKQKNTHKDLSVR
jgi:hypothetical protein